MEKVMKMFLKRLILIVIIFGNLHDIYSQKVGSKYLLNNNNFYLPFNYNGILADVTVDTNQPSGRFDGLSVLFSGGFFLSGYTNGQLWTNAVASASRINDYLPGRVGSQPVDPKNAIYVVKSTDSAFGTSWQDWRDAVSLGASFFDGNNDSIYNPIDLNGNGLWDPNEDKPDLLGNLTAWCVYNDGVPSSQRRFSDVEPQGIEVQQTVFNYSTSQTPLGNIIFVRYRIVNKGTHNLLDTVYFSAWADPDLGYHGDDLAACDTLSNSGYIYNNGDDYDFGINPPVIMMKILQGPYEYKPGITFIDNNGNGEYDEGTDTPLMNAYNFKGTLLGIDTLKGARNKGMTSYIHYMNSHLVQGDPNTKYGARNYTLGFKQDGLLINPCTWSYGIVTGGVSCDAVNPVYSYSGDPVNNIGWINNLEWDHRHMINTGPFKLKHNKPVDIIVAYLVGRGSNALNSITVAKSVNQYAKSVYDLNYGITTGVKSEGNIPDKFKLYQNYPNPFNPITKIQYSVSSPGIVQIKVYDMLGKEIKILVNEFKQTGTYEINFHASNLSSGVYYYKMINRNFIEIKKMIFIR